MSYTLRIGTLKRMGREITCMVSINAFGELTIQNAPPDLSDGEYVLTFSDRSMLFRRFRGGWKHMDD